VAGTEGLIAEMRRLGVNAGLAINPETDFEKLEPWLDLIDHVLVMTVHPGFGGQKFMHEVVPKIRQVAAAVAELGVDVTIEVDGGIDLSTIDVVASAGARVFVAGNAVFSHDDPGAAVAGLRERAEAAIR
jgi:ribulose-phosphate 3-epimerase